MRRFLKFIWLILIIAVFLDFAVVNRQTVALSLFPLPYSADIPEFMLTISCFALGAVVGSLIVRIKFSKLSREMKRQRQRAEALQNELKGLQSEKFPSPAASPLPSPASGRGLG